MHEWGISANPGEDGPDMFLCMGVGVDQKFLLRLQRLQPPRVTVRLGKIDTSGWPLP